MNKVLVKKIIAIFCAVILVAYVGYQIYRSNYSPVETETAMYVTAKETIDTTGYAVRDEEVISKNVNGVISYLIDDGDKVANNGDIAKVYASPEDAIVEKQINSLNNQIDKLTQLNYSRDSLSANPTVLDKQISQSVRDLIQDVTRGMYSNVIQKRNNILYSINERQITTGKIKSFDAKISELESQKSSLEKKHKSSIDLVSSPSSGYFISKLDGFESSFEYNKVLSINPQQVKDGMIKGDISKNPIGKIMKNLNWYITCLVSADDALLMGAGKEVSVRLPFASTEDVPFTVAAINQADKKSDAALILRCDYISKELSMVRKEPIQININSYSGVRISKKALHEDVIKRTIKDKDGKESIEEKKVQGVYVLYGGELKFKQVIPIYADANYIICDSKPKEGSLFNGETIQIYDQVVTEGLDLYNGKVIK